MTARIVAGLLLLPALCACLAVMAANGGALSPRLDVLTHFTPLYLAVGLIALLAAASLPAAGMRPVLAAVGALTVLASLPLIAPELMRVSAARSEATADDIKIIQFNAWGQNREGEKAIAWILAERPDFVLLEEGGQLRNGLVRSGYHATCSACGALIMSKMEPAARPDAPRVNGRRLIAHAAFRDGRGDFDVIVAHKSWPSRVARLARERAVLKSLLGPLPRTRLIIAGDFNSTPWSFALRDLDRLFGITRRTRALPTWPADRLSHYRFPAPFPFMPIDHVYAGPGWSTVSVRRGPRLGSDHYPVVVVLAPNR